MTTLQDLNDIVEELVLLANKLTDTFPISQEDLAEMLEESRRDYYTLEAKKKNPNNHTGLKGTIFDDNGKDGRYL